MTEKDDTCASCSASINSERPGCTALSQTWHIECFTCVVCANKLAGGSFYAVEGRPYCEADYIDTLEKCADCDKAIMERILRASGKPYHPACFKCSECTKCLDGVPFTADESQSVHCVPCFHEKYAPKCAGCTRPITPEEGKEESYRVVAMDNSYHVDCYKCADCAKKLSSKVEGHGCYPLDKTLLCKECNTARVRKLTA